MPDDELQKTIAKLLAEYGKRKFRIAYLREAETLREMKLLKPSRRGAPAFAFSRDVFIFVVMFVLTDGGGMTKARAARWVANYAGIRVRQLRHGNPWRRNADNARTISRIFSRAKSQFDTNQAFRDESAETLALLFWWRDNAVKHEWGFMISREPHIGFAPRRPQVFTEALDAFQGLLEDISGKQKRFLPPPKARN